MEGRPRRSGPGNSARVPNATQAARRSALHRASRPPPRAARRSEPFRALQHRRLTEVSRGVEPGRAETAVTNRQPRRDRGDRPTAITSGACRTSHHWTSGQVFTQPARAPAPARAMHPSATAAAIAAGCGDRAETRNARTDVTKPPVTKTARLKMARRTPRARRVRRGSGN